MNISATVCEYNPYHNGHKYLADCAKSGGDDYFVGIMSGNVVQRGEFAVADKFLRARAAVLSGVDLIIELPCVYSLSSAEGFAYGAVKTLDLCGCIDKLYFGAECEDTALLMKTSEAVSSCRVYERIKELSSSGYSHPRALHTAVREIYSDDCADVLSMPNNTLGVEYIRALSKISSHITPCAVLRKGAGHDADTACGEYASASFVRQKILSGDTAYREYIPKTVCDIIDKSIESGVCPARLQNNQRGLLQTLRTLTPETLREINGVGEGLENRLYKAFREYSAIDEVIQSVKCKRYTYARLCRVIMCAYLGITKRLAATQPQYIRVLSMNKRGIDVLRAINEKSSLPVIISPAKDKGKLTDAGKELFDLECRVTDLYGLFTPTVQKCGKDYTQGIF